MRKVVVSLMVLGGLALSACTPKVESIGISNTELPLVLTSAGQAVRLEASALDASGGEIRKARLTFSSSDPSVATVDSKGTITAVRSGMAEILVTSEEKHANVLVDVQIPVAIDVRPTPPLTLMGMGTRVALRSEVLDSLGRRVSDAVVEYAVDDPSVAEFDGQAVIARAPGKTQAIASFGGVKQPFSIVVSTPPFENVAFDRKPAAIRPGESTQVTAQAIFADGKPVPGVPVRYESSNEKVAKVDPATGEVVGVGRGRATVTARAGEKSTATEVVVHR